MQAYRLPLIVITLLLTAISTTCSVLLWLGFADGLLMQGLAGSTAVGLEGCKLIFLPLAFQFLNGSGWRKQSTGVLLLIIGAFLFITSVAATVGFLESASAKTEKISAMQTVHYQVKTQQLDTVNERIRQQLSLTAIDSENNYRKRAYQALDAVKNLEVEREQLLADINTLPEPPQNSADAILQVLSIHSGGPALPARYAAFLLLALLVDLCPVVALCLIALPRPPVNEKPIECAASHCMEVAVTESKSEKPPHPLITELPEQTRKAITLINNGEAGGVINTGEIRDAVGCNYRFVAKGLEWMESAGMAERFGRKWRLVEVTA